VGHLADGVHEAIGETVEVAFVDQGYVSPKLAWAVAGRGTQLEVVRHHEAKRGFMLLLRRWIVERACATRLPIRN
jgi:hypothetical protein